VPQPEPTGNPRLNRLRVPHKIILNQYVIKTHNFHYGKYLEPAISAYTSHIYWAVGAPHRIYMGNPRTLLLTRQPSSRCRLCGDNSMFDIIAVAITVSFFAVAVAYVHACDRL
jgi:hypothetical protein